MGAHDAAQAFDFMFSLPQPSECWDYRPGHSTVVLRSCWVPGTFEVLWRLANRYSSALGEFS